MINFGDGTNIHTLPEPSGSIDFGDRLHFLDLYSGADQPVVTGQNVPGTRYRRRHRSRTIYQ